MKKIYINPKIRCVIMDDDLMLGVSNILAKPDNPNATKGVEEIPFSNTPLEIDKDDKSTQQGLGAKSSDWDD